MRSQYVFSKQSENIRDVANFHYKKAIEYNGLDNIVFKGVKDVWYLLYTMTNYRVPGIDLHECVKTQHEKILYYVLVNVCKKSHKEYHKFGSRFI